MFILMPTLKRFRLVPLLLCTGVSLALNLWPALSQAQTVTLSVDPLFVHYSSPMPVIVTAKLSDARTEETRIILRLSGTALRGTDYTTDDSLPAIIIAVGETSSMATLSIGGPPDGITERATKTIIVRGRASGVSVSRLPSPWSRTMRRKTGPCCKPCTGPRTGRGGRRTRTGIPPPPSTRGMA